MLQLPVSFFLTLLILQILFRLWREGSFPGNRFIVALLSVCALQSLIVGLRWGYNLHCVTPVQLIMAISIPPLFWLSFRSLSRNITISCWLKHSIPVGITVLLTALPYGVISDGGVDAILFMSYVGYGIALLVWQREKPDDLVLARLDNFHLPMLLKISAWVLIVSGGIDVLINLDIRFNSGSLTGSMISTIQVIMLGWMTWITSQSSSAKVVMFDAGSDSYAGDDSDDSDDSKGSDESRDGVNDSRSTITSEEKQQIHQSLERLMEQGLYRDIDLNCAKLARKVGFPARKVSSVINQMHQMNVSQYVNRFRVQEACRLLRSSDDSVVSIALQSGFC